MKKIKNLFRKIGKAYLDGVNELYSPVIKCNLSPCN